MVFTAIWRWNTLKFRLKLNGRIARISKTYCSMDAIYLLRSNHCPTLTTGIFDQKKGLSYQRVPQLKYKKIIGFELHISAGHILAKNVTPFRSRNFECSWFHSLKAKSHSHPHFHILWNRWSSKFGPCHLTVQGKCSRYLSFYNLTLTWLEGQPQTNASIWHHNFKEATQNVVLQRWIRLVILCHHQLASTDWEIKITCWEFQGSSMCGRPKKGGGGGEGEKCERVSPISLPFLPYPYLFWSLLHSCMELHLV